MTSGLITAPSRCSAFLSSIIPVKLSGVLQLLNAQSGKFSPDDVGFLNKLSGHMAMALENAQMHRDTMEKQRMERELSLARSIQHRLLPEAPPVVPGYDIAVLSDFCFDVAADYYDFINLGPQSLLVCKCRGRRPRRFFSADHGKPSSHVARSGHASALAGGPGFFAE